MPAAKEAHLVRRVADGRMYTIQATTIRNAMITFVGEYRPPTGETFWVKLRCASAGWTVFNVTQTGIRQTGTI